MVGIDANMRFRLDNKMHTLPRTRPPRFPRSPRLGGFSFAQWMRWLAEQGHSTTSRHVTHFEKQSLVSFS